MASGMKSAGRTHWKSAVARNAWLKKKEVIAKQSLTKCCELEEPNDCEPKLLHSFFPRLSFPQPSSV